MISLEQEDMRVYREDGKVNTTIGCVVLKVTLFLINIYLLFGSCIKLKAKVV